MGEQTISGTRDGNDRLLIGIDPGSSTGVCVMDLNIKKIKSVYTLNFWSTFGLLQSSKDTLAKISQIYIEQPSLVKSLYARHSARLEETKSKIVTRDKIVWNAGENAREGSLLAQGLRDLGYTVFDCRPVGRKKWTAEQFNQITGWESHSNQHVRDAAFLVWDKTWQAFPQK